MKILKHTYALQDTTTKQLKMYKAMTAEESWDANLELLHYGSRSQWVQTVGVIIEPEAISRGRVA